MEFNDALALVDRIYSRLAARRPDIERSEEYYEGDQPLSFATEEWRKANAARYAGFSDNWCGPVVNAEAERLHVIGVTGVTKAAQKMVWDSLQHNEFEMQSSQGFVTALAAKRTFVIVWGDSDGQPLVTFEHPSFVEIEYDFENPRIRKAALKTWVDDKLEYATLYTPDEIWKFERKRVSDADERKSQAQQSRTVGSPERGWVPREGVDAWVKNPLGVVPVVEIPNRPTLKGDPISEIQGVMAMQDAINLLWAYLFLASDYASMKARVVTGAEPPQVPILDDNGVVIGYRPLDMKDFAEKRIAFLQGENAKIDEWDAASLDQFLDVIDVAVGHIASQTRTPPTYLVSKTGMSNVNSEGLKASEIGLNKKAGEFIRYTDPALREMGRLVGLVKGDQKVADQMRQATWVWENPEIRSEGQLADALLKKRQLGYPFEYLMELDGHDPRTIKRVLAMREAELADMQIEAAMRGLDDSSGSSGAVSGAAAGSGGDGS